MTLQQLEYIIAVDTYRHFATAAKKCFVTQPTLSMMIQKLESELEIKIFHRQHPVSPTPEGVELLARARKIIAGAEGIKTYAAELKGEIKGTLHLGIIPTLAPYLLPLFLKAFTQKHPQLRVFIKEMVTDEIIAALKNNTLDVGLLATPLNEPTLTENTLFYEEFFAYAAKNEKLPQKKYLLPAQINTNHLWLLEEGHCLRNQVFNLCELKSREQTDGLHYEAGSIETLINLVDRYEGITIIPGLAVANLKPAQRNKVREFARPKPSRQISLVVNQTFPRKKVLQFLKEEIVKSLPLNDLPQSGLQKGVLGI